MEEIFGFTQDVTESEQRVSAAEVLNRAKSQFISNVSHDMRTPLNAIIGCGHLLEGAPLEGEHRDHLDTLNQASQFMLGLINDLLDLSKIEAGEFSLTSEPFALAEAVTAVANVMRVNAAGKGLEFRIDPLPADLHGHYLGDPLRLRQILFNLLSNAIKFTDQGHVRLCVARLEAADGEHERIRFEISDTGSGISKDNVARLFKRFSQVDDSSARRAAGSGLGLSIVRELSERMGGFAEARSELGVGSTFSVEIELPKTSALRSGAHGDNTAEMAAVDGTRVLVVDDSSMNRKVASRILTKAGATVATADDGQQALDWLAEHGDEVDIILMDVQMPVMDGITAVTAIRADTRFEGLPVVAMTAAATAGDQAEGIAAGMSTYVSKPFEPAVLRRVIRQLVDEYRGVADVVADAGASPAPDSGTTAVDSAESDSGLASAQSEQAPVAFPSLKQGWRGCPEIAGVDMDYVSKRFQGQEHRYGDYMDSFVRSFDAFSRASIVVGDDDIRARALTVAMKNIRTSAKLLGAREIENLVAHILDANPPMDEALRSRYESDLQSQMDALKESYEACRDQFQAFADGDPTR